MKNNKALSPVVASIILIAVVIAVSIAATTWMGSISFSFMEVDEFRVTRHSWASDNSYINLTIQNFGTTSVTISKVELNGETASSVSYPSGDATLSAGETTIVRVTHSFVSSKKYEFKIITTSATKLVYIATASTKIWYNPSWLKRKAVTIDNTLNPNDLTGYQIQVNVTYASDMNNDFSDLRFTDSDGQTLISYWVESYVPSHSVVWVKVPSISASSTETIYMYYGNPSATSESNPDDTVDLFLDFTIDDVISYGGSQDSDSTQWEIVDDTILRMWGNNWKATMKTLNVAGDGSQAICFDFKSNGTEESEINGIGLDIDDSISPNWFYRIYGTQNWGINDHYGYTGAGDWQSYTIVLDNFSGDFNRFVFSNDADAGQATNIYYRNVRVSQYTSQAPSTGFGAEETM